MPKTDNKPLQDEKISRPINQDILDHIEIAIANDEDMQALFKARIDLEVEKLNKGDYHIFTVTDMAILSAGDTGLKRFYISGGNEDNKYSIAYYDFDDKSTSEVRERKNAVPNQYRRDFYVRPVLDFSNMESLFDSLPFQRTDNNGKKLDYSIIELGWAPRYTADYSLNQFLDKQYKKHKLKETGEIFTFDKTYYANFKKNFEPLECPVYEFEGKKYIRYKVSQCTRDYSLFDKIFGITLSRKHTSSMFYNNGDYAWVQVTKIPWLVDIKRKRLISKEGLISGIQFNNYQDNPSVADFQNSNIKWFLENYMKREILQNEPLLTDEKANAFVEIDGKKEAFSDEITEILNKIDEYKKFYFGDMDIDKTIDDMLNEYNSSLNELAANIGHESKTLFIGPTNPRDLFQGLKNNLENLLLELKTNCGKIKDYYDMIDILNECQKDKIDPNKDELCTVIATIREILNENITNANAKTKLKQELNEIIAKHLEIVKDCIERFKQDDRSKVQSLEDLKLAFRRDIHPFLENRLKNTIANQNVVNEIMNNVKIMIDNHFTESKNKMVSNYLNILNRIISTIKTIGDEEDKLRVKALVNLDFDPSDDINVILKNIELMIRECYKIQFEIIERVKKAKEIDSYRYNRKKNG